MIRLAVLAVAVAVAFARTAAGAAEPAGSPEALRAAHGRLRSHRRPNVILITIESVGANDLMPGGALRSDVTPTLAALASRGVVFDAIYAGAAASLPSYVLLETGVSRPSTVATRALARRCRNDTLAKRFRGAGYRTAYVTDDEVNGLRDCLTVAGYHAVLAGASRGRAATDAPSAAASPGGDDGGAWVKAAEWVYQASRMRAPAFVHVRVSRTPSFPLDAIDRQIREFLAALESSALLPNTIVAVTGSPGATALAVSGTGGSEAHLRTMLIVTAPVKQVEPVTSHRVASFGGVGATLLEVAGIAAPLPDRSLFAADVEPRPLFFELAAAPRRCGLRDRDWLFIGAGSEAVDDRAGLYDLRADPERRRNIAAERPARVERYAARCSRWMGDRARTKGG